MIIQSGYGKKNLRFKQVWRGAVIASLAITFCMVLQASQPSYGESLFRGNANYGVDMPYTPPSLFSQPIPKAVGDIITVAIDESTTMTNSTQLSVARTQDTTENASGLINRIIHKLGVPQRFSMPDLSGLATDNNLSSEAEASRASELKDNITCQVVQVLPNGNLVIQGTKGVLINKDRVDMIVSGIVNPYYLNADNTIASTQVANFQLLMGGKGVLTRQQSDGVFNKIYQWFQ